MYVISSPIIRSLTTDLAVEIFQVVDRIYLVWAPYIYKFVFQCGSKASPQCGDITSLSPFTRARQFAAQANPAAGTS